MKRSRKAIVQLDVSEEAPLEASKVVRHYTKKKRVATLTEQCLPNPAAAGNNHVNVKEEYDPDIEAMSFNREIDNHVKIKQEDVTDTVKFDLNCTFDKANDQETIKEDEQVQRTRNDLPRRAKCSRSSENIGKLKDENKSSVSIKHQKIKEENVSDSKVTRRELLHTEIEIDIKMEPQDDESHKEKNIDGTIVETGVLQPEKDIKTIPQYKKTQHLAKSSSRKSVEINVDNINGSIDLPNTRIIYLRSAAQLAQELNIKQETDYDNETAKVLKWRITNDIASSTDKPDTNIANVMIQDSTSLANNNENPSSYTKETPVVAQAKLSGIAFAHTMNQPNSIIGNVKIQDSISLANNNENPSNNTKGVPAVTQVKLKRIAFAPRPLRTYGRKQPDTVPFKKCFLVTVNNPPTDGRKLWKEKLVDLKGKEPLFMCDMCDRRFYNKAAVSQHIRNSHLVAARRHECGLPACGARFAFHFQLLAHRRAHAGAPLACDLCDLLFKSRRQYGVHLNTHLRERLFPCPICMRRYAVYEHLLTHAAKHTPADTFPCASCDASFRTVVDSARHAERDHGEKTEFPCYYCGRTLDSNAEMLAHVATRHDNRLHYCAFCPRRFDDVERFERHSAEHVQQITPILPFSKRHVCDICNKKFSFASVLKTHMATHTGARPFECGECGRRLKTRSALTEHVTAHRKPYACPQCARRFGKRGSLARHLLLHSADKPHKCTECDQEFSQRWSMMLHKKRSHAAGLLNLPKKKPKKNGKRAKDSS